MAYDPLIERARSKARQRFAGGSSQSLAASEPDDDFAPFLEKARARFRDFTPPEPEPLPEPTSALKPDDDRGGLAPWARPYGQVARGVAESVTSLGRVAGMVPGLGAVGRASEAAEDWLDEEFGDSEGWADVIPRAAGRFVGEAAQAIAGGGVVKAGAQALAKGSTKAAPAAGALARALEGGRGVGRLKQAGATSIVNAPIDIAQGLKEEEGLVLPGREGSVIENLLFSGVGSLAAAKPRPKPTVVQPRNPNRRTAPRLMAPEQGQDLLPQVGQELPPPEALPENMDDLVRGVVNEWMSGASAGEVRDKLRQLGAKQLDPAQYLRAAGIPLPEGRRSYFNLNATERAQVGPTIPGTPGYFKSGQPDVQLQGLNVPEPKPRRRGPLPKKRRLAGGPEWDRANQEVELGRLKFWEALDDYGLVLYDKETGQPSSVISILRSKDVENPMFKQAEEAMRRFRLRAAPRIVERGSRSHPLFRLASSATEYTARQQALDPDVRLGSFPRGETGSPGFTKTEQDVGFSSPDAPSQLSQRTLNRLGPPKRQSAGRGKPVVTKLPKGNWEVSIGTRSVRVTRDVGDKGWYMVDNDTGPLLPGVRGERGERMPQFRHVGDTKEEMLQNVSQFLRQREKLVEKVNRQIARAKPEVKRNKDRSVSLTLRGKSVRLIREPENKQWVMEDPMDPGARTPMGRTREEAQAEATKYLRRGMRAGTADPQVMAALAGSGVGGMAGFAVPGEDATMQDRLLLGAAGAAAGAGLGAGAVRALRKGGAPRQQTTPAMDSFLRHVARGERGGAAGPGMRERWESFLTNFVSETRPLVRAAETGGRGAEMRQTIGAAQGSGQAGRLFIDENLKPILTEVGPEKWDAFRAYVLARRDLDLRGKGVADKTAMTVDQLRQVVADGEAMGFKGAADRLTAMYRNLLDMRRQAGLITDEDFNRIVASEDLYVPFAREWASEAAIKGSTGKRWTRSSSGVKGMTKDEQAMADLADPLEVAVQAVERTFKDVGRQRVANILGELADAGAVPSVKRIPGGTAPGVNAKVFRQVRDGKVELYEVTDPELYDAIASSDPVTQNHILKLLQGFKRVKQAGITLMPDFSLLANPIRDVAMSGIQRPDLTRAAVEAGAGAAFGAGLGAGTDDESALRGALRGAGMGMGVGLYARPLLQTLRAAGDVVGMSDLYKQFLREGGSTEGFFVRNPEDARKVLDELRRTGVSPSDILSPKRWVDALRYVGSVGEQATRVAAFRQRLDAGASVGEAILDAQDRTLRFANVGRSTKGIASVTAFWNAKVQGWDKLARMLKKPSSWALGAGLMTAPSISLWSVNKDNPEYWQRPLWERNLFWLVPKGGEEGGFYRIPKPFEVGYLFASLPERMLDFAAQKGLVESAAFETAEPGRGLARSLGAMAGSTFEGTIPVPDLASAVGQLAVNKDLFRNAPIERNTGLPKAMRETEETSGVARALGNQFMSPSQIDFAIRQATGTMGSTALSGADALIRAAGGEAPAPRPGIPLLSRRFTTNPAVMTEQEAGAADRLNRAEEAYRGLQELREQGNAEEFQKFLDNNAAALQDYATLSPLRSALRKTESQRRTVRGARSMEQADREAMLNALRSQSRDLSERVLATPMLSR